MRFLKYLGKHKLLCITLIVLTLAGNVCNFMSPYVTSDIVNNGIQNRGIEYGIPYAMDNQLKTDIEFYIPNTNDKQNFENSYDYFNEQYTLKQSCVDKKQLAEITEPILAYFDYSSSDKSNQTKNLDNYNNFILSNDSNYIHQSSINYSIKLNEQFGVDQIKICFEYLLVQAAILLAVFFISLLICLISSLCSALIALKIGKEKRLEIYESILKLNSKQIDRFTRSSLIIRSTTDVQVVQTMCLMILNQLVGAPLGAVVGIVFAFSTAPSLLWIVVLGAVLIIIAVTIVYIWAKPKFMILQTILDRVASNTRRIINGSLVYRAFNRQQFEYNLFNESNNDLYKRKKFVYQLLAVINPLLGLGYAGMTLLIVLFGSIDAQAGLIQTGQIIAFISYANMVVGSFVSVGMLIGSLPSTTVSANRIDEIIETANSNAVNEDSKLSNSAKFTSKNNKNFDIAFNDVTFKYDSSSTENIKCANFKIKQGSTVAIIGVTGSGKSTLCKLMLNLYDCDDGSISFGNTNYKNLSPQLIRSEFSYAGQDSFLFSRSIKENILYGVDNTDKKNRQALVEQAIKDACLTKLVNKQQEGANFKIQQNAKNVSGGQKQRISIARALKKQSEIYIFDDCFSAVDFSTEAKLFKNIQNATKGKTKIFVTQKISMAKNADQILVMDNGQIVGNDTHKNLITNCSEYIEICKSQNEEI